MGGAPWGKLPHPPHGHLPVSGLSSAPSGWHLLLLLFWEKARLSQGPLRHGAQVAAPLGPSRPRPARCSQHGDPEHETGSKQRAAEQMSLRTLLITGDEHAEAK